VLAHDPLNRPRIPTGFNTPYSKTLDQNVRVSYKKSHAIDPIHGRDFQKMKQLLAADALASYPDHNRIVDICTDSSYYLNQTYI
jgi:hypothetical protein